MPTWLAGVVKMESYVARRSGGDLVFRKAVAHRHDRDLAQRPVVVGRVGDGRHEIVELLGIRGPGGGFKDYEISCRCQGVCPLHVEQGFPFGTGIVPVAEVHLEEIGHGGKAVAKSIRGISGVEGVQGGVMADVGVSPISMIAMVWPCPLAA